MRDVAAWSSVTSLATDHGLRPALIEFLSAVDWKSVPDPVRAELEDFQRSHLLRTLEIAEELARVARTFQSHGIPFALFKGAAVSIQLYGRLAAREYNDLDLIVPAADVARAEALLSARGYRPAFAEPRFRRFFQGHQGQTAFRRDGGSVDLDLHWTFSGAFLPFPLQDSEIWDRLTSVPVAGVDVPTLAPADTVLLLAGHGTKEGWRSLMWLRDFAFAVDRWRELDWADIHRRAHRNGCGDSVLLACALAEQVLGTAVPPALARAVAGSERVAALADALAARLREGNLDKRHLDDLALCDRRIDRWRAGLALALTPTPGDFDARPLPRALWPAYYLLRPVRLLSKAVRGTLPLP
ncbi:MAG: nucleotidyltransferase family protein [Proteobacteria bacterium]|nr:nucleotidyltransferase family protein [Pseudomonadota bacterium]